MIALAAMAATAPLRLGLGFSCGDDFDFHLSSWFDALHAWRQGIVYPHWAASANYFAGEPRFVFYPPLTWMLGAALHAVLPWAAVPLALSFLLLFCLGLAVRRLALEAMSGGAATLAGCFAVFSAYPLFTVYERADFAELAGSIWIALLMLYALRELRETARPRVLNGTSAVLAGAWLSNPPAGVMASYLFAALTIAVAAVRRSWVPVARGALSGAAGLGLAAFYWLPAWREQRWVQIEKAVSDPGERVENNFLFAHHGGALLLEHDPVLLRAAAIAGVMIGLSVAGWVVARGRGRLGEARRWWMALALIPVAVLLLQLPLSLPVWNALPELRFLQFPWRWMVAAEAPMGVLLAAAVWPQGRRARVWTGVGCAAFFAASAGVAGAMFHQECHPEDTVPGMTASYEQHAGFEGTEEYAPPGADNSAVAIGLPDACLVADAKEKLGGGDPDLTPVWQPDQKSCAATFQFTGGNDEHLRLRAEVARAGYLVLRLRRYPAWRVRVNGAAAQEEDAREDGLMAVRVAAGTDTVTVDWTATPDVVAGRWLSGLALAAITGVWLLERRRKLTRLE